MSEKEYSYIDLIKWVNDTSDENRILKDENQQFREELKKMQDENKVWECAYKILKNKNDRLMRELSYHDSKVAVRWIKEEANNENRILKDFIKKLANDKGEILLYNGYGYNIKKLGVDLE